MESEVTGGLPLDSSTMVSSLPLPLLPLDQPPSLK
jgi:hypothetical protein